jgi:TPP-dependent pyruvate/acetoin dehydrogenase alpha subunit
MEEQGMWDEEWAGQLHERLKNEVEQAMQDALRDVS